MICSKYLASTAVAAILTLPLVALGQPAHSPGASPLASRPAAGNSAEQRVEQRIRDLHAQLRITSAEQSQWEQFANVMRENARAMDQAIAQRTQQYPTMTALQNMQSYAQIASQHSEDMQKLVPAFDTLYNAMSAEQKQVADQVFRSNAEGAAQRRMQTGRNEER
jgi:periplasmic protein CpxP/Spy